MHPRLTEIEAYLARSHEVLLAAVAAVPVSVRQTPPAAGGWSVAEVLEHLGLVEQRVAVLVGQLVDGARAQNSGPDPDTSPLLGSIDAAVVLDRSRKYQAIESAQPRRGLDADTALAELERARTRTLEQVRSAQDVNLGTTQYSHALFGPLNGYQWLVFTGAHEQRHAAQILEITAVVSA